MSDERITVAIIPVVRYRALRRALERQWWKFEEGSRRKHQAFIHEETGRRLTLPYKRGDMIRPVLVDAFN